MAVCIVEHTSRSPGRSSPQPRSSTQIRPTIGFRRCETDAKQSRAFRVPPTQPDQLSCDSGGSSTPQPLPLSSRALAAPRPPD
eukprot:284814745_1